MMAFLGAVSGRDSALNIVGILEKCKIPSQKSWKKYGGKLPLVREIDGIV